MKAHRPSDEPRRTEGPPDPGISQRATSGADSWWRQQMWAVWVAGAAAFAAPAVADALSFLPPAAGWLFSATQVLALLALATAWSTVADVLGRLDLGHAVFIGVGAYTCGGAVIALGWPPAAAPLAGAAGAALLGAVAGALLLRLPAPAFSLATFGLLVLVRELVRSATPLTRGPQGLALPATLGQIVLYRGMLVGCLAALALGWALRRRRREVAASVSGRIAAYAATTAVSGLVGGLWAAQRLFVNPDNAFAAMWTFDMAWAAALGGIGTPVGPLAGGAALLAIREVWPVGVTSWRPVLEGVLLIAGVLLLPGGLLGRRGGDGPMWTLLGRPPSPPPARMPDTTWPAGGENASATPVQERVW
ncbi:hypothetical protein BH23ACT9_BH23ACT9_34280 [soil metagenome]